jgi:hypothetical protein
MSSRSRAAKKSKSLDAKAMSKSKSKVRQVIQVTQVLPSHNPSVISASLEKDKF